MTIYHTGKVIRLDKIIERNHTRTVMPIPCTVRVSVSVQGA